jgi:hypothetical protein
MPYTREELDWVEGEWAFHLHGRSAFMSREDFAQLQVWAGEGVPAEAIVAAMEAYFERRQKRAGARTFVALEHLAKDVAKAVKLRAALQRAGSEPAASGDWDRVKQPLRADPKARLLFEAWQRARAAAPAPDAPGFLEHFDEQNRLLRELLALAEARLGDEAEPLRQALAGRLTESKLEPGTLVWKRAWSHHWGRILGETWGIPL